MSSRDAISSRAISDAEVFDFGDDSAIDELAFARVASPIIFLEVSTREIEPTQLVDVVPGEPDLGVGPLSSHSISSLKLPFQQRRIVKYLFATAPWCGRPGDILRPNQRAAPRVITAGRISRSIPVDVTAPRRGQRTIGDAQLSNPDGELDFLLTDVFTEGQEIRAWLARPQDDAIEWVQLYEAYIESIEATRETIRIRITTVMDQLKRPLQLRKYTGSGGLSGDADAAGKLKPVALGEVWGAAPVLISKADNIYAVNDGPINSIDRVMEGGLDYTFTADYPTFDSLATATLAAGEYATSLQNGIFRVGLNLEGLVFPLRVVLRGDASGNGYQAATGEILYRLARNRAFLSANLVNLFDFQALPASSIGYYADGSRELTVENVFDELLRGVAGWFGVGRGLELRVGRLLPPESLVPELTIRQDQLFDIRIEGRPDDDRSSQPYTYAKTANPVSLSEVSPVADADTQRRLTQNAETDEAFASDDATFAIFQNPTLPTYFVERSPAQSVSSTALAFSSVARLPVKASIGRLGVKVDLGDAIAIQANRFKQDFTGVVFDLDENLGAVITTRITAIG